MIKRISVFCGSGIGSNKQYAKAARKLGKLLSQNEYGLVFGGGKIGLMGEIARSVIDNGGKLTGVIPRALAKKEVGFHEIGDLRIVNSMHERKAMIAELSDAFIAMPGGFGTFEEIFEAITWTQLGIHDKACAFLNVNGYYDHLITFIDHAIDQNFIQERYKSLVLVDDDPEKLLEKIKAFVPVQVDKARWALEILDK